MTYLIWTALALYGAFFIFAALSKFIKTKYMVEAFKEMEIPYGFAILSALTEIIAGPALIAGIQKPELAGLGAMIMVATTIGATIANYIGKDAKTAIGVFLIFCIPMILLAYHFSDATRQFLGV